MRQTPPESDPPLVAPWQRIATTPLADYRVFTVRSDRVISPRTGATHDYFVIDCTDWVNVVATTPDDHLVMVEQYRHGSGTVELEVPGGMMDPGERSPVATAIRELREETGYVGDEGSARVLGATFPNPALMSNTMHTVLVEGCVARHAPALDAGEDLATRLVPIASIPDLIREGRIRHALIIVALFHHELWRRRPR
jgi:8-oxo-dGTP pyrophosphatase MutT (NUDIX family)